MIRYLKCRLKERSSWVAIVAAITAASMLEWPWDIAAAIAGIIGVLVPEGEDE
jgi:uncharacterized membrane protein